jgi:hypothetical protein
VKRRDITAKPLSSLSKTTIEDGKVETAAHAAKPASEKEAAAMEAAESVGKSKAKPRALHQKHKPGNSEQGHGQARVRTNLSAELAGPKPPSPTMEAFFMLPGVGNFGARLSAQQAQKRPSSKP